MSSPPLEFSEDFLDSETLAPNMTCIKDDKEFIRNVRARTMVDVRWGRMIKGGERVGFLRYTLRQLSSSLRPRVLLDLLQGSNDREDIWLWNEGDEALMEWKTLRRREVQSAAFEMRAAMIGWLALTSTAYKSADEEHGVRDREEWDMQTLITVWCQSYDDREFIETMDQAGHSCHQTRGVVNSCWLFMRSQLFPTQQDSIIYLGGEHCARCLAHKLIPGSESPPSWTPSRALVALRDMWDTIESHYDERRDFPKWLLQQPIYEFKEANEFLSSLPQGTEDKYLPWVNTYPPCLHDTVTKYSLEEWQGMNDCIRPSERGGSPNIRSWCAAMCWRMTPDYLLHSTCLEQFIDAWCYSVLCQWDFLPPPTSAPEFRDAIRDLGHTCWEEPQMDDYATAMAFLDEEAKVVGIDVRKYSECQVCRLQWRLRSLGENLPAEERAFEADLTELEDMLRTERSRRILARGGILVSVQQHSVPRPMSNSDHQEQQDPHHTLYDHDEQRHEMSTDHLNAPYHPQLPISQVRHLSQSISNTSHQDINIPYVRHNSTGSQQDNYSVTPMANPITDGIQDQGNAQYPALLNIQPPFYTNSTRSGAGNYTYGPAWVLYDQSLLQDFEPLQTEVPGRQPSPLLISDPVNPSVENDVYSQPRDSGATMNQDNLAAVSVQQEIISDKADLSKDDMIKEIKKFFTESFERLGVELHGTKRNKKLPWLQFDDTLDDEGIEMVNWPKDVLTPGKGSNSSKGLAGVPVRDLKKIYKAIHSDTAKLELRHIPGARKPGQAVSQQEFFAESSASGSRKRPRDAETDKDSRPKKQLVFKNIRYDGVMEAWKVCLHWFLELSLTLYRTD
ncbi:hypothetical protein C8J56DRAFT_1051904 [Mycena floridula]|nr:hypothetical protein C8J56DRAFT_1051904 [Mycena floridula]